MLYVVIQHIWDRTKSILSIRSFHKCRPFHLLILCRPQKKLQISCHLFWLTLSKPEKNGKSFRHKSLVNWRSLFRGLRGVWVGDQGETKMFEKSMFLQQAWIRCLLTWVRQFSIRISQTNAEEGVGIIIFGYGSRVMNHWCSPKCRNGSEALAPPLAAPWTQSSAIKVDWIGLDGLAGVSIKHRTVIIRFSVLRLRNSTSSSTSSSAFWTKEHLVCKPHSQILHLSRFCLRVDQLLIVKNINFVKRRNLKSVSNLKKLYMQLCM